MLLGIASFAYRYCFYRYTSVRNKFPCRGARLFCVLPDLKTVGYLSAVELFPEKVPVFKGHIGAGASLLRDRHGARIHINVGFVLRAFRYMRMSVQKNIPFAERRNVRFVIHMTVCGVYRRLAEVYHRVIRKHGKIEHHLIDLRLAVASDAHNAFFHGVEHGDHLFRSIFLRKIVPRSVIKDISEKEKPVGTLRVKSVEQSEAARSTAVNIGCNKPFHFRCTLPRRKPLSLSVRQKCRFYYKVSRFTPTSRSMNDRSNSERQ